MAAHLIDFFSRREKHIPHAERPEQLARERVQKALEGFVEQTIISQARARVVRAIIGGRPLDKAVNDVIAWALSADHPDLPPVA